MSENPRPLRNRRPARRNYLVYPKIQLTIVFGMILVCGLSFLGFYGFFRGALSSMGVEALRIDPACQSTFTEFHSQELRILDRLFIQFGLVTLFGSLLVGVLVSHRIVGPVYRIKTILSRMLANEDPVPFDCREGDFFRDIFPMLKRLHARTADETKKETQRVE